MNFLDLLIQTYKQQKRYITKVDEIIKILEKNDENVIEGLRKIEDHNKGLANYYELKNKEIENSKLVKRNDYERLVIQQPVSTSPKPNNTFDIKFYLDEITKCNTMDDIKLLIEFMNPKERTINVLISELQKKYNKNLIDTFEYDNQDELLEEIKKETSELELLIYRLKTQRNKKEEKDIKDNTVQNKVIFLENELGNVAFMSDLTSIPREWYGVIYDLLKSIENGRFIGKKNLRNNIFKGLSEVRKEHLRIIYDKIIDVYVVIMTYEKKTNWDMRHQEALRLRANEYHKQKQFMSLLIEEKQESFKKTFDETCEACKILRR